MNEDIPIVGEIIIRPSSLNDAADCARRNAVHQFREDFLALGFKLTERLPVISAAIGTGVHHGIAALLNMKKAGQKENLADALGMSINKFEEEIKGGIETDDTTPDTDSALKQITNIMRVYAIQVLPKIQPKLIEHKVRYPLGDGYVLEGTLDAYDYADFLHDAKTGRSDKSHAFQFGSYTLGLREEGETPKGAQADNIERTKLSAKKGQAPALFEPYDVNTSAIAAYAQAHRIKADHQHFLKTGNEWSFMPNPNTNLCHKKYCNAWGTNACTLWREKQ